MERPQAPKRSFDNGERNCVLKGLTSSALSMSSGRLEELLGDRLESNPVTEFIDDSAEVVRGLTDRVAGRIGRIVASAETQIQVASDKYNSIRE